jgi:hypothetical protein
VRRARGARAARAANKLRVTDWRQLCWIDANGSIRETVGGSMCWYQVDVCFERILCRGSARGILSTVFLRPFAALSRIFPRIQA